MVWSEMRTSKLQDRGQYKVMFIEGKERRRRGTGSYPNVPTTSLHVICDDDVGAHLARPKSVNCLDMSHRRSQYLSSLHWFVNNDTQQTKIFGKPVV